MRTDRLMKARKEEMLRRAGRHEVMPGTGDKAWRAVLGTGAHSESHSTEGRYTPAFMNVLKSLFGADILAP